MSISANFFLGPKAENADILKQNLKLIFTDYVYWRKNYFPNDIIDVKKDEKWKNKLEYELQNLLSILKANYPFYSPRYMAHMLSETIIPGILGYFAGMLYNPNNVTDEAGPVTVNLELEFGKKICKMLGYNSDPREPGWAHIVSGGSLANLESLWVAREIQFFPLVIKEYCENYKKNDFKVKLPNREEKNIAIVSDKDLLSLKPNEKIFLQKKFIDNLMINEKKKLDQALDILNNHVKNSKFSIRWRGFINVMANVKLKPVIFIPESAHYSWDKTISILGFGDASIKRIPINDNFRIDSKKLEAMLYNLNEDEFVVAVITVVGTTEEGAVDPVHEVLAIRKKFEREKNMSFWLHIDSAWGGFIRSLFNVGDDYKELKDEKFQNEEIEKLYLEKKSQMEIQYKKKNKIVEEIDENALKLSLLMNVEETFIDNYFSKDIKKANNTIEWNDFDVIKAFLSFNEADSITVDPHKLGYIQYPAGVIAFKHSNVVNFISQKASYISKATSGFERTDIKEVDAIGPYIIEGSKPGAAAVACWLSEKTIPFNRQNHGEIIKRTLLNAKRFFGFIDNLNSYNKRIYFHTNKGVLNRPYSVYPLYRNIDTNLVCFYILPMKWDKTDKKGTTFVKDSELDLKKMNELNEKIYKNFTILNEGKKYILPYSMKYFLSRTKLTSEQYSYDSIQKHLSEININREAYNKEGLFVMRATLMNPFYQTNDFQYTDYYGQFFLELNNVIIKEISTY